MPDIVNTPDLGACDPPGRVARRLTAAEVRLRLLNIVTVTLPFAGLIAAVVLLWGTAFNWLYLALLGGMYLASGIGITVGYHRLFTHRSFKAPRPVAAILAALGSMAVEGPILQWVATHRCHHQHSDDDGDPHSPHTHGHGPGFAGALRGLWHAHVGWIFATHTFLPTRNRASRVPPELSRYVRDLRRDPLFRWMNSAFPFWVALGLLIPTVVGGLATMSWTGALLGFIWGGLVRVALIHHVTWSINSVCHIWGTRPFRCHDESRNNAIFGVLALGEGWHNNHHAFPTSARHGLRWWQLDLSYLIIRGMGLVGLASDIRVPSADRMIAKRASA
ncbi:MAG: acyl-CoA desaturase [Planctomycetota bacterium]|jgi:stearoyl-CoA desaturase (delta-9 desaturase)